MDDGLEYGVVEELDAGAAARVLYQAFGNTPEIAERWLREQVTMSEVRVLRGGREVMAGAVRIPMGTFLGGVSVPQIGIAGVGVTPDARGRGLARRIMREMLLEMRERGEHVSTLYSAMHPLYRSLGYETAGHGYRVRVPAGMIQSRDRGRGWRASTPEDESAIKACAAERARLVTGALDRGPDMWRRIFKPRQGSPESFVADAEGGGIEAYCIYRIDQNAATQGLGTAAGWQMHVIDFGYIGERGLDRLLGFLQGFSSVVGEIVFDESPNAPLLDRLGDRRFAIAVRETWMLRVVSLQSLAARGYPAGLRASIGFRIADSLLETNERPVVLEISDRKGKLRDAKPDEPVLELTERDLATLYTGMHSASQLANAGGLRGPADLIELADSAFAATGGPCMFDSF